MNIRRAVQGVLATSLATAMMMGFAPGVSQAAVTTQVATADTFVNGDAPTGSFGTNTTMRVDDGFPKISYVKFPAAPAGTLADAKLRVHGTGNDAVAFKVYKVPSTWTESTTYNTRPTLGAQVGSGTFVASGYTQVDVDAGVTPGQVTSLAIVRDSSGSDTVLSTRETTNEPELVVDVTTTPPPPVNTAPATSAGPDQAVTLPAPASLDGTVSDDGLPSGTTTQSWSKVSGPGAVTFGSPTAQDTSASFAVDGTYVLRLTANDGALSSSDDVTVTVSPEPVVPPAAICEDGLDNDADGKVDFPADPGCTSGTDSDEADPVTPPPTGGFDILGLTEAQIDSIPIGTPEWAELVAMADDSYAVDHLDGATDGSGNAVAGAIVYVRTGNAAYKTKVENALADAQSHAPNTWQHAAANRKVGGWAAAGQLIDKPVRNSDGSLNAWGSWLNTHRTVNHTGVTNRSQTMIGAAYTWDNNHGAAGIQSLVAIDAYLDLPMTDSCDATKAWLGGTHSGWSFTNDTSPEAREMGWTGSAATSGWYVSNHLSGVNPSTAWAGFPVPAALDGAIASDVERDNGVYPNIGSAGSDHYVYGNLYRHAAALVTLAANGCDLWPYADNAMKRAQVWAQNNIPDHENDYLGNADAALNAVYGLSYPDDVGGNGENFLVASEWLTSTPAAAAAWPAR